MESLWLLKKCYILLYLRMFTSMTLNLHNVSCLHFAFVMGYYFFTFWPLKIIPKRNYHVPNGCTQSKFSFFVFTESNFVMKACIFSLWNTSGDLYKIQHMFRSFPDNNSLNKIELNEITVGSNNGLWTNVMLNKLSIDCSIYIMKIIVCTKYFMFKNPTLSYLSLQDLFTIIVKSWPWEWPSLTTFTSRQHCVRCQVWNGTSCSHWDVKGKF